jgi:hypothetical protein
MVVVELVAKTIAEKITTNVHGSDATANISTEFCVFFTSAASFTDAAGPATRFSKPFSTYPKEAIDRLA